MSCARFEEMLFAAIDGPLADADARNLARHTEGCERCRALQELMAAGDPPDLPADLAESILAATSPAWSRTFAWLDAGLRELDSMQPDEGFVDDVLAATSGPRRRAEGPAFVVRLRSRWARLLQRPRLAFEAAYVGSLAIVVAAGLGAAPSPVSALDALRQIRDERVQPAAASAADRTVAFGARVGAAIGDEARGFWSATIQPTIDSGHAAWCETFACEDTEDIRQEQEIRTPQPPRSSP